jgi:RNA polymerase sigma factor (sigma-70 family)
METYEMDHLAAPNADPLDVLTRDELEQAIERAIAALPEHYREVFVLLRIEGCSQREAAQMLDIPIGTVQSRLGRAVSKLRSRLMGEGMVRDDGEIEKGGADHAVQFRA